MRSEPITWCQWQPIDLESESQQMFQERNQLTRLPGAQHSDQVVSRTTSYKAVKSNLAVNFSDDFQKSESAPSTLSAQKTQFKKKTFLKHF